ncbi:hypothetical protein RISK_005726 [Rhodopirellula islandica]|uniref:Uncharacterized protein n=1 Tax=Rhodopirellula islandica TaxID=595434 RepID=A0A0J1B762_RHOIS|nr:hypothetical protein RISK_005726 [Rhodopirellula islandica]
MTQSVQQEAKSLTWAVTLSGDPPHWLRIHHSQEVVQFLNAVLAMP